MPFLIQIFYFMILILYSSCYLFNIKYSYVFKSNNSGYSVFLQQRDNGFRLFSGAAKQDRLVTCYNSTDCRPISSPKNQAGLELFGAAIHGGDKVGDFIYVCAPRYIYISQAVNYRINGRCFVSKGSNFKSVTPLSTGSEQFIFINGSYEYYYAHGQAGFSIKYIDEINFLVGAPGVLSWTGTVVKHSGFNNKQVINPGKRLERNSYLGYSVDFAKFYFARKEIRCIIAGAPRGDNLLGQVLIMDYDHIFDLTIKILTGDQIGSYFGASLLVTENELFVSAPVYTTKTYEEGCVFVYKNDLLDLVLSQKFCGHHMGGRFGTAMTKIGFISLNSNLGVAISAPYADNGVGIVYIYVKSNDGYKEIQQIHGKNMEGHVHGFGFSLSNAVDTDQNKYNDFAIGSLDSDNLIILRSKKILQFSAHVTSKIDKIHNHTKNITVGYCFLYKGRSDSDEINVDIYLESDDRVTLVGGNKTLIARIGVQRCEDFVLVLTSNAFDSPLPLTMEITNNLQECPSCAVAFPKDTTITYQIPFVTGCGEDNVCTPELTLQAKFDNIRELIMGTRDTVTLTVIVNNLGETAYLCKMNMTLPTEISKFPAACSKSDNIINCDISNRIIRHQKKQLQFQFDVKHLDVKLRELKIEIALVSAGSGNGSHVKSSASLPISLKSNVAIVGFSNPDYLESEESVRFLHEYVIFNSGPSPLVYESIEFQIPEGIITLPGGTLYPFTITPLADECIPRDLSSNLSRKKRDMQQLSNPEEILSDVPQHLKYSIDCNNTLVKCKFYHCLIGELSANASLKYKFNIDVSTSLLYDSLADEVNEKSLFLIESIATSRQDSKVKKTSVYTILNKKEIEFPNMWIWIVGAVLGSLVILGIIIAILYKANFFSRPMRDRLINEEESKNERECFVENNEFNGEQSPDVFNAIQF